MPENFQELKKRILSSNNVSFEDEIRELKIHDLAKLNNSLNKSGFVVGGGNTLEVYNQRYSIVKDELFQRGVFSSPDEERLVDGKELKNLGLL